MGQALEGFMETDAGWSGGWGDGLELSSPTPTSSPFLVRSRPRKDQLGKLHQPSLAPEETSGDSSQVLSAEKEALRTWAAAGLLWTQQLQEVVCVVLTAGRALLWNLVFLPEAPALCTQCPPFHRHREVNRSRLQRFRCQSWIWTQSCGFRTLKSAWIWFVP